MTVETVSDGDTPPMKGNNSRLQYVIDMKRMARYFTYGIFLFAHGSFPQM